MVADEKGVGSQLVKALIEAKKKFKTLVKNKVNPHFKSRYADLAAVHDAVDDALAANGLAVMQILNYSKEDGPFIQTELLHTSGESKVARYLLPAGQDSQKLAAAITYGRRNSLCSLLAIPADDDDDGEAEQGRSAPSAPPATGGTPPKPAKASPAKPKADPNHWIGNILKVESPRNGVWKATGDGIPTPEFGTATPEHADVAKSSIGKCRVSIRYTVQVSQDPTINGLKRITAIEPVKEESNG